MRFSNFIFAIFLLTIASASAWACRRPAVEEFQRKNDAWERKELQRLIAENAEAADLIFVGTVLSVEMVQDEKHDLDRYSPKFDLLKVLKGPISILPSVVWKIPSNSIHIPCGPLGEFSNIELQPTFRYLVFVRAGKIIRARRVIDRPQEVPYEEELQIVRKRLGV